MLIIIILSIVCLIIYISGKYNKRHLLDKQSRKLDNNEVVNKANINFVDKNGETPLIKACNYKWVPIISLNLGSLQKNKESFTNQQEQNTTIKYLIKNGANVNAKDRNGQTPLLIYISQSNNLDIIKYLVEHGADINSKDNYGNTPLINATNKNYSEIIRNFTKRGININNKIAILPFINKYLLETVKYLIGKGAIVDESTNTGMTPLMMASSNGNLGIVKYLIEHGADVNAKDFLGYTSLILASECGYLEVVKYLVEHGADINAITLYQETSFIRAFSSHYFDIAVYLAQKGADVNSRNKCDSTALMTAILDGKLEAINSFIKYGADVNLGEKEGKKYNPLLLASKISNLEIVKTLVEHGADINAKDKDGNTPLIIACDENRVKIVKFLVKKGSNVNLGTFGSLWTPLNLFIIRNNVEMVKFLVEHGADVNFKATNGFRESPSSLRVAIHEGNEKIIDYLISQGAKE